MTASKPRGPRCPHCATLVLRDVNAPPPAHLPFCSDRCKMADLSRWLNGEYAVPSLDGDDDELAQALESLGTVTDD